MQIMSMDVIITLDATVAQLVEQLIRNQQVRGSSPLSSFLRADQSVSSFSCKGALTIGYIGIIP